jgi:O-antigen ligase
VRAGGKIDLTVVLRFLVPALLLGIGMAAGYAQLEGWRWPWWWYSYVVESGRPPPPEAVWCVRAGWAVLAATVMLTALRRWRGAPLRFDWCDGIILALPAWLLLAGVWLGLPRPLILIGLWPQLAVLLLYFLGRSASLDLRGWSAACVFVATVLAVTVLLDAEGLLRHAPQRPAGLLNSRNHAGQYLALALPSLLVWGWRIEEARRHGLRVLCAACALFFGLALVLTRSRTAWIAAAAGTAFVLLFALSSRRLVILPVAFVLIGALIGGYLPTQLAWKDSHPFWSSARRVFDISSGSGAFRRDQYRDTLRIAGKHPMLGVGPAGWSKAIATVNANPQLRYNHFPNSDYLRFLCEGGFIALLLFLGAGATFLHRAWKLRAEQPQVFATLAALALICASDAVFTRAESSALICALLAALVNPRQAGEASLSTPRSVPSAEKLS